MYNLQTKSYDNPPPCTLDKGINNYVQSISLLTINNFLTIQECDKLIQYGDNQKLSLGLDRAGYKSINRHSLVAFLDHSPDLLWLRDKLINRMISINNKYQKWDLTHLDRFHYVTYSKNDYLDHHNDDYFDFLVSPECKETDLFIRKMSISLVLSDPSEYEGGELEIQASKGTPTEPYDVQKLKPSKGTLVMFPSFNIHKIHKVTSGRRVALVAWFFGPKWK